MPLTILLAIFVAFWFPSSVGSGPMSAPETMRGMLETGAALLAYGLFAALVGRWLTTLVRYRFPAGKARRVYQRLDRWLDLSSLLVFGMIVHELGWSDVVESGLGLRGALLVDEFLILLPFLLLQLTRWCALYPAEHELQSGRPDRPRELRLRRYLVLKARGALGLVLPVALLFALAHDLGPWLLPDSSTSPWYQFLTFGLLGGLILILSPAFVRLSWPAQPLPPGPLRDRLERLAQRHGFRFTEILVWDTGGAMVNAGITGALPWFRYILLTDALVENLEPRQVEAVFGHEVGHVAHRHLGYFGLFCLGSMGVLALVGQGIEQFVVIGSPFWIWGTNPSVEVFVQATAALVGVALYFLTVFGYLSRRFERQADVFGCRTISCGRSVCPPHLDLNASDHVASNASRLCPVGIRIFIDALQSVARLNGMEPEALSWRHGSIARRVAFLEGLEGRPEMEQRFQRRVRRLRFALVFALTTAVALAVRFGAMDQLR